MGTAADKYRVGERIGGGGMAEVYRGHLLGAEGFERPVAIKRILTGYSNDVSFARLFVREARIASLLAHPNITSVIDFDRDEDGHFFIVMELVEGKDLRALTASGPIPPSVATYVITELLQALGYAHHLEQAGRPMLIVHRDVSPHNVLLSWQGGVKLTDFGIARAMAESPMTKTGVVRGKAAYSSPEQSLGGRIDHRSDLFAVGVMLHELLSGKRLFGAARGAPDAVIMRRVMKMEVPDVRDENPHISQPLADLCGALLRRSPTDRPATARVALEALFACPEISPRGQLELTSLLRERFGGDEGPTKLPLVPAGRPVGDFTDAGRDEPSAPRPVVPTALLGASPSDDLTDVAAKGAARIAAADDAEISRSAPPKSVDSAHGNPSVTDLDALEPITGRLNRSDLEPPLAPTIVEGSTVDPTAELRETVLVESDASVSSLSDEDFAALLTSGDEEARIRTDVEDVVETIVREPRTAEPVAPIPRLLELESAAPGPARSSGWATALAALMFAAAILLALLWVREPDDAPSLRTVVEPGQPDVSEEAPRVRAVVQPEPHPVASPRAAPSAPIEEEPATAPTRRPTRRPHRAAPVDDVEARPQPAMIRARLGAVGRALRAAGAELPRSVADTLDGEYLDLRSATRDAVNDEDWRRVAKRIEVLERAVDEARGR